jgi:hypothetical protein
MPSDRERVAGDPEQLESLRRAVYRAGASAGDRERLRAEQARLDAAPSADPRDAVAEPAAERDRRPPAGGRHASILVTALLATLALLLGAAIGSLARAPDRTSVAPAAALAVFQRAPEARDDAVAAARDLVPAGAAVRHLRSFSTVGVVVSGVRTRDGRICLLVVVLGADASAACVTERGFLAGGVAWSGSASADPVDDSGRRPTAAIEVRWRPTGMVSIAPITAAG